MQRFAVRGRNLEILIVGDAELTGLGDIGTGIDRNIARVDQLTAVLSVSLLGAAGTRIILLFEVQQSAGDDGQARRRQNR